MGLPSFFCVVCGILGATIGSEPSSVDSNQESLKQKIMKLEVRISSLEISIPQTSQLENEQILINVLDEMEIKLENYVRTKDVSDMAEALRKELQKLLSNHSLRIEDEMRNQTLLINKLSSQLEDVQNSCFGEPPSPQNGSPVGFERKHGSEVNYECDQQFFVTGNSTVRCRFGKWEGKPPLCILSDTAFTLLAQLEGDWPHHVSTVSCSSKESPHKVEFSRVLDTGTGGALPTGTRTYSRGREAVLDLSGVHRDDRGGVYECWYDMYGKRKEISFVIQRGGFFEHPQIANIGDTQLLGGTSDIPSYRWLHEGEHVPALDGRGKLEINGVRKEDAGIYELYDERNRHGTQMFYRLVVRRCLANFFGERCNQNCTTCHNGGVCHEQLGTCVCSPGFQGENCEEACGQNRVGPNCSESCEGGDCKKQLFCKPDPYGCSGAPGYVRYSFNFECVEGKFGVGCEHTCHCYEGFCDSYTGACSKGCFPGFFGPSCQITIDW